MAEDSESILPSLAKMSIQESSDNIGEDLTISSGSFSDVMVNRK
jgi:hypothetical protein